MSAAQEKDQIARTEVMQHRVPVTVLSGFLGAGKTTLLKGLMARDHDARIAVIVNDMSEINIDAKEVANSEVTRSDYSIVEMTNGCICCELREDLLVEITRLAKAGRFDYILVESTGIGRPLPIAETFSFVDESGFSLADLACLDTMVTVVDATDFSGKLRESGQVDGISLRQLLVDQVEFADVLVVTKTDLTDERSSKDLLELLALLNPRASIIVSHAADVEPMRVMNTGLFSLEAAASFDKWLSAPRESVHFEKAEFDISSLTYSSRVPFHPRRFADFMRLYATDDRLLRAKGYLWLADKVSQVGFLDKAGAEPAHYKFSGFWWNFVDRKSWPSDEDHLQTIKSNWNEQVGDCRQELVFIGRGLDLQEIRARLDDCRLSKAEILDGPEAWVRYSQA